jgi:hypothetical protein
MDADLMTSLSKLLAPILSSPDAMRSLSSLFGGSEETAAVSADGPNASEGDAEAASAKEIGHDKAKRREQLLRALRPYLSPAKGERLEGLVRASAMLELLGDTRKV